MRLNIDFRLRNELLNFSINGKQDLTAFAVYTRLLMLAQYEDVTVNGVKLKCGQVLTSIRKLSTDTGLTERGIRTVIKHLVDNGYIEQHSTRNYTVFTICHYNTENKSAEKENNAVDKKANSNTRQMNEQEKEDYYNQLVQKYMHGTLTAEEQKIFDEWK